MVKCPAIYLKNDIICNSFAKVNKGQTLLDAVINKYLRAPFNAN